MTFSTLFKSSIENEKSLVLDGYSDTGLYVIKFIALLLVFRFKKKLSGINSKEIST